MIKLSQKTSISKFERMNNRQILKKRPTCHTCRLAVHRQPGDRQSTHEAEASASSMAAPGGLRVASFFGQLPVYNALYKA